MRFTLNRLQRIANELDLLVRPLDEKRSDAIRDLLEEVLDQVAEETQRRERAADESQFKGDK